jgi:Glycosyltransferase
MKILIISIFPAPYRVEVFNELGKYVDLTVLFEKCSDHNRPGEWFSDQFHQFKGYLYSNKKNKRSIKQIKKQLNKKQFDMVFLYDYSTLKSVYYLLVCRFRKIPYIINCDGAFISKSRIKKRIKTCYIKNAAGCLASGKIAAEYFKYYGADDNKIYYHPFTALHAKEIADTVIPLQEKQNLRKSLGLDEKKTVITVTRFITRKRVDVLIKAWSKIQQEYQLIIVGSGDLEQEYKNLVKELELHNVNFTGYLNKKEVMQYMRASDLFVLPTDYDPWGLVVNEALSCGLPVVTTEGCIAGLELIQNGINGYLVPVHDSEALYLIMEKVLSDEKHLELLSEQALCSIREYTYENIAKCHADAINCIKKGKKEEI